MKSNLLIKIYNKWRPLKIAKNSEILVVQAHTEDFIGGCGALVHFLSKQNHITLITLFKSGKDENDIQARELELNTCTSILSINSLFLKLSKENAKLNYQILNDIFYKFLPTLVIYPFSNSKIEKHPSHCLAGKITESIIHKYNKATSIRYANVTGAPAEVLKTTNLVFVLFEKDIMLKRNLYMIFKTQINKKINPKWVVLKGEENISNYIDLMNLRTSYFTEKLNISIGEDIRGLEIFKYEGSKSWQ